jgi:hypothetical protein
MSGFDAIATLIKVDQKNIKEFKYFLKTGLLFEKYYQILPEIYVIKKLKSYMLFGSIETELDPHSEYIEDIENQYSLFFDDCNHIITYQQIRYSESFVSYSNTPERLNTLYVSQKIHGVPKSFIQDPTKFQSILDWLNEE